MILPALTDTLGSPHRFNSLLLESFKIEINAIAIAQLPASRLAGTQLWGLLKGKLLKIRHFFHFYYCYFWIKKGNTKSLWRKHLFISKSSWSSAGHCLAKSCSSQHCIVTRQSEPPPIANQHLLLLPLWKEPVEISLEMEEQNKEKKLTVPSAPAEAEEQRQHACVNHCFTATGPLLRTFPFPTRGEGALSSPPLLCQHHACFLPKAAGCILHNFIGLTFQLVNSPYQQIKASSSRWAKWLRKP